MAAQTGIYRARLLANYTSLYLLIGLRTDGNLDLPLYDFLVDSKARFREYYSTATENDEIKVEASIAEVAKLSETSSFLHCSLLDFDSYERIDYLLNLVLAYQDVDTITPFMSKEVKELIEYMSLLERNSGKMFKNTLSYMTIRNFLMLLVNKKFIHASVYATFIKEQIFLSEGLSPKVRFSDLYKGELGLAIMQSRASYSAKIRRRLKKQVKDIIKNTKDVEVSEDPSPSSDTKIIYGVNVDDEKITFVGRILQVRKSSSNKAIDKDTLRGYILDLSSSRDEDDDVLNGEDFEVDERLSPEPSAVFVEVADDSL